jgi:hypothetical protein
MRMDVTSVGGAVRASPDVPEELDARISSCAHRQLFGLQSTTRVAQSNGFGGIS